MQYLGKKPYNFSTNTLKAYLSAQPSSLSISYCMAARATRQILALGDVKARGP